MIGGRRVSLRDRVLGTAESKQAEIAQQSEQQGQSSEQPAEQTEQQPEAEQLTPFRRSTRSRT